MMMKKRKVVERDDRVTDYLLPDKIILTGGDVANQETLLTKKPVQIFTHEKDSMLLKNTSHENAFVLLDFGLEFSGGVRILTEKVGDSASVEIRLVFGESVCEAMSDVGFKNATNDHSVRDLTVSLTSMSDMTFSQTGYRFLKIELLSKNSSVTIPSILGVFTYRDIKYQGSFECNDALINQIYDICAYTCHLNMQGMLWDGIKRDRLVWVGDMHPEMLTIRTVFGEDDCIEKSLDYAISKTPLPSYPNHMVTYAMWFLIIVRDWYWYTGKKTYILKQQKYIEELISQLCGLINDDGTDNLEDAPMGYFLDWPSKDSKDAVSGVRALFSISLSCAAEISELLGANDLSAICRHKSEKLKIAAKTNISNKPAAALMNLAGHMDDTLSNQILLDGGAEGLSTFMSYYILTVLSEGGNCAQALEIMKEYYGGMIDAGATTFWEDFDISWIKPGARIDEVLEKESYDIHGDNGGHCYKGFRHSLCHGWSSAPTAFLAEQILGIKITKSGCREIEIIPNLGNLDYAKGSFPTPYGVVHVSHVKDENGKIKTEYFAPKEIKIKI